MEEVNKMNEYEKIDEIVLRHTQRGMHILREHQKSGLCESAAREILSWEKETVLLTTGFYVAGYAETDGPAGTMVCAKALAALGYHPASLNRRGLKPNTCRWMQMMTHAMLW